VAIVGLQEEESESLEVARAAARSAAEREKKARKKERQREKKAAEQAKKEAEEEERRQHEAARKAEVGTSCEPEWASNCDEAFLPWQVGALCHLAPVIIRLISWRRACMRDSHALLCHAGRAESCS
jgi:hypothetical protein